MESPGLAGHRGKVPCLPDPREHCVRLWHDRHDLNQGGLYSYPNVRPEIDGGKMDGFIKEQEKIFHKLGHDDVAGYHTGADISQLRPIPAPTYARTRAI